MGRRTSIYISDGLQAALDAAGLTLLQAAQRGAGYDGGEPAMVPSRPRPPVLPSARAQRVIEPSPMPAPRPLPENPPEAVSGPDYTSEPAEEYP